MACLLPNNISDYHDEATKLPGLEPDSCQESCHIGTKPGPAIHSDSALVLRGPNTTQVWHDFSGVYARCRGLC
jgi:hypothetical protein